MKTLFLIRHAKSDWSLEGQPDIDRPLNSRGYADAHRSGIELKKRGLVPSLIISSPAIRAISTALILAEEIHYNVSRIRFASELYESSIQKYLDVLHRIGNENDSAAIVGHNSVLSELNSHITRKIVDLPTCAIVILEIDTDDWMNTDNKPVTVRETLFPKMLAT